MEIAEIKRRVLSKEPLSKGLITEEHIRKAAYYLEEFGDFEVKYVPETHTTETFDGVPASYNDGAFGTTSITVDIPQEPFLEIHPPKQDK